MVRTPALVAVDAAASAAEIARKAVETVGATGTMGVEMFLAKNGAVLINELAPSVHNSGHYTIEACVCSQFENHIRAVLGLPLGSTAMVAPAAVMINLLGAGKGTGTPHGLAEALAVPGLLDAIARHPADGYVVACFGDPGLDAARELAAGPVVGIAEAAMRTAAYLGRGTAWSPRSCAPRAGPGTSRSATEHRARAATSGPARSRCWSWRTPTPTPGG